MTSVVAATTWGVTAVGLVVVTSFGQRAWFVATAALLLVLAVAVRRTTLTRAAALVLMASVLGGATVTALRVGPLLDDPLVAVGGSRAPVVAELLLAADPQARVGRTSGSRRADDGWSVDVAVQRWHPAVGPVTTTDLPARLLGSGEIAGLLPGTRVRAVVRVLEGSPLRGRAVVLVAESVRVAAGPPVVQAAAGAVRSALRAAVRGRPPDQAGLLPGLVVGDTSAVPADLDQAMRDSSLTHLVAVSGGNVAVVVLVVLAVVRRLGLRRGSLQVVVVALGVAANG